MPQVDVSRITVDEDNWQQKNIVITNVREDKEKGGFIATCFSPSDWSKLCKLESQQDPLTAEEISELTSQDWVLVKEDRTLCDEDRGFRRANLVKSASHFTALSATARPMFKLYDFDKRNGVRQSHIYPFVPVYGVKRLKLVFKDDPGREIIGQKVEVMTDGISAAFVYTTKKAVDLIDDLQKKKAAVRSLDQNNLQKLVHRLQTALELF